MNMFCDANAGMPDTMTATDFGQTCNYEMNITTKYACASSSKPSNAPGGNGWDWGKQTLLIVPLILVFYCGIGFGINYQKGMRGKEAVPQVGFWSELPGLVKDGCKFTYNKIQEMRDKS